MRVWELSISVVNEVGAFVLPGFTAKRRDVEKTPEMRDSDQKNCGRKVHRPPNGKTKNSAR